MKTARLLHEKLQNSMKYHGGFQQSSPSSLHLQLQARDFKSNTCTLLHQAHEHQSNKKSTFFLTCTEYHKWSVCKILLHNIKKYTSERWKYQDKAKITCTILRYSFFTNWRPQYESKNMQKRRKLVKKATIGSLMRYWYKDLNLNFAVSVLLYCYEILKISPSAIETKTYKKPHNLIHEVDI